MCNNIKNNKFSLKLGVGEGGKSIGLNLKPLVLKIEMQWMMFLT